ncbi:hypothetical protein HDE69_000947 [Pedobacter cryoconitis]|uniref:Uncharacterized protein n=1 Tax=Pedobacter cryoconitis TaxID=188932 RepID=A0A7W8YQI2_9SPHI|nr:hypothetical protein [Pedobacter cryoconitis]MBB5648055.1 hypothetical protein [Pedobacter cryoconitis]
MSLQSYRLALLKEADLQICFIIILFTSNSGGSKNTEYQNFYLNTEKEVDTLTEKCIFAILNFFK